MGYNITKTHLKPRFVLDSMEKQAKLPSSSDIARADAIELEEIAKSTEDLISQINNQSQTDDLFEHPLRELLGLDKQLWSIRDSLKVEVAKRCSWKNTSRKSITSSRNSENILECMEMTNSKRLEIKLKD